MNKKIIVILSLLMLSMAIYFAIFSVSNFSSVEVAGFMPGVGASLNGFMPGVG